MPRKPILDCTDTITKDTIVVKICTTCGHTKRFHPVLDTITGTVPNTFHVKRYFPKCSRCPDFLKRSPVKNTHKEEFFLYLKSFDFNSTENISPGPRYQNP